MSQPIHEVRRAVDRIAGPNRPNLRSAPPILFADERIVRVDRRQFLLDKAFGVSVDRGDEALVALKLTLDGPASRQRGLARFDDDPLYNLDVRKWFQSALLTALPVRLRWACCARRLPSKA